MTRKPPKPKRCQVCREKFQPARPMMKACGPVCALALVKATQEKKRQQDDRKATRAAKERVKTRGEWAREAQAEINRYVRLRDRHKGCVSCAKGPSWDGQWHCSHFRSVGAAPELRFNLWNMHKGCSICNNHLSGNIQGYRPELVRRIGLERVEWLEGSHEPGRYTIDYLRRLKSVFSRRSRLIERSTWRRQ